MLNLSQAIFAVNRTFTRICHIVSRKTSLSQAQYEILLILYSGEKDVGTLASMNGVTQSTMTKNLNVLYRDELIAKYKLPEDNRVTRVCITPRGKSLMKLFENSFERAVKRLLKNVSVPEQALVTKALGSVAVVFDPLSRAEEWAKEFEQEEAAQ